MPVWADDYCTAWGHLHYRGEIVGIRLVLMGGNMRQAVQANSPRKMRRSG